MKRLHVALAAAFTAAATPAITPAAAQSDWPNRPVTLIVPFAAGGGVDASARMQALALGEILGQTIVVENVGAAAGTVGSGRVAKAAQDGYTMLIGNSGTHVYSQSLYKKAPYDSVADFEPVSIVTGSPRLLVARKDLPASNLQEFIAYMKANKDKVSYANAGLGAASHLCGMLFMSAIQTDFTTVPYKGTGPAMNDLLGGQVDFMCDQTTNTTGQIKGGKVKVYGVTTLKRVASLPDVPTLDEQGMKGFSVGVWHGVYAPKKTPKPILDTLVTTMQHALHDADLIKNLAQLGTEPVPQNLATPQALQSHLKAEIEKWGPIIKKAGVYAD